MKIAIRLEGTKKEVESTLITLKAIGLTWKTDEEVYGSGNTRCEASNLKDKLTYFLNDVKPAQPLSTPRQSRQQSHLYVVPEN
jgi:hypothetical protein